MGERVVYQGDIFLTARGNIVATLLQTHSSKRLVFCTTVQDQHVLRHRIIGLSVHLLPGERLWCCQNF
jgi:hypothetical protein